MTNNRLSRQKMRRMPAARAERLWREAISAADKGDLSGLREMFEDEEPLSPDTYELLANLLSRHKLKKLRGGQRVPIYRSTAARVRRDNAASMYKLLRAKGVPRTKAIEEVAAHWEWDENAVANYTGGRGSKRYRVPLRLVNIHWLRRHKKAR